MFDNIWFPILVGIFSATSLADVEKELRRINHELDQRISSINSNFESKGNKGIRLIFFPGFGDDSYQIEQLEVTVDGRRVWMEALEGGERIPRDKLEIMLGPLPEGDHRVSLKLSARFQDMGNSVSNNRLISDLHQTMPWHISANPTEEWFDLFISTDQNRHKLILLDNEKPSTKGKAI